MSEKPHTIASALFPLGLLMIAMISIQSGASLAKSLFPVVGAQGTTTLRLVFASLILIAILRPWRANLTAKSVRTVVIYGIALGSMNLLFYMSLQTVPLGIAVALEFTGPLAVALLSSRKPIDFLWVSLAVIGLLLLIPLGASNEAIDLLGAAYALGAGVCWAAYIVFGHKAGADNGVQTAALGVMIAALFIGPVGVIHAGSALFDISLVPAALGVAILSTALPYSLEMIALTRMSARTFGTLASLEPVFAALSGLVFLHESLSLTQWLAIGAIIFASIGATLGSANTKPQLVPAD
ncbi:threonine transporter RhtB [Pseudomonas amygdali pv. eriobotryae]|uniref:threonine/homoserine exporter RhtA n=1 Tax=Pseudomonas amygdali TaxID=47877 RepID=UPI0016743947|nr:threonine/homoserine exporter RhtA [Pseudomonas amygdali]GFZ65180.1 threonine transporter RhtB [Pseudomonas amygdali pv. eriobotryae]